MLLPRGHQTLWLSQGVEEGAEEGAGGGLKGVHMERDHWEKGKVGEGARLRQNHCHQWMMMKLCQWKLHQSTLIMMPIAHHLP